MSLPLACALLGDVLPFLAWVPLLTVAPGLTATVLGFFAAVLAAEVPLPTGFCVVVFGAFVTGEGFFGGIVGCRCDLQM